jgi:hypothetical protein
MPVFDFIHKYANEPTNGITNVVGSNAVKYLGSGLISGLASFGLINKEQAAEGENVLNQIAKTLK